MKTKNIALIIAFLFCGITQAQFLITEEATTFNKSSNAIQNISKITFSNGSVNIITQNGTQSTAINSINKLFFNEQPLNVNLLNNSFELLAYPNPVFDKLFIQTDVENASVEIFSLDGRLLKSFITYNNVTTTDFTDVTTGIYIVKVTNGNQSTTKKIIVK